MVVWRLGCGLIGFLAGLGRHAVASRAAKSQWHLCLGPCLACLGPMLGHLGAKLGPRWVFLCASWAMLGHVGALLAGLGRHLEADSGLGSTVLEPTCGEKATSQKLQTTIEKQKTLVFDDLLG